MALSDLYSQQPYVPYNDSQLREGLSQLPAAASEARNRRPVTAWEKAVMRLMAGHDPKAVAADTKAQLALGGDPSDNGQAAPPQPQALGYNTQQPPQNLGNMPPPVYGPGQSAGNQMPQVSVSRQPMSMTGESMRQPIRPYSMDKNAQPIASIPPQPIDKSAQNGDSSGGISDATFGGMQHQDYNDFVSGMKSAHSGRLERSQADFMAVEQEKTRRAFGVEDKKGATKLEVSRMELNKEGFKQHREDIRAELDRRIKKGLLDEKVADDIADNQLGYAKLQEYKKNFRMAHSQNERLKMAEILYRHADSLASSTAKSDASLFGRGGAANADIKSTVNDWNTEATDTRDAAKKFMDEFEKGAMGASDITESSGEIQFQPRGGGAPRGGKTPVVPPKASGARAFKNKKDGTTINATQQEYDAAVKAGTISAADWE